MDNQYNWYRCYMTSIRAQNPAFKALWERLSDHFDKKFKDENSLPN